MLLVSTVSEYGFVEDTKVVNAPDNNSVCATVFFNQKKAATKALNEFRGEILGQTVELHKHSMGSNVVPQGVPNAAANVPNAAYLRPWRGAPLPQQQQQQQNYPSGVYYQHESYYAPMYGYPGAYPTTGGYHPSLSYDSSAGFGHGLSIHGQQPQQQHPNDVYGYSDAAFGYDSSGAYGQQSGEGSKRRIQA